ncbi:hypothetical protein KOR34_43380 [Posidoniimonas corsicana]|uniref:Uncharacterized protein n=1 Tax=Posidoniimonas corsicana TaxID=1938618 RepID=A0A5C5UZN8_9BACT|nr:hypothetical protein KOR34_43380 [Posidoniimonas corsicana]
MPKCPRCESERVYLSNSQDRLLYRLVLLARVRCHNCCASFFAAAWRSAPNPANVKTPHSSARHRTAA